MTADFRDDPDYLFHACALTAFVEQAREQGGWPDSEATRQRAYRLCEWENARRKMPGGDPAE